MYLHQMYLNTKIYKILNTISKIELNNLTAFSNAIGPSLNFEVDLLCYKAIINSFLN